MSLVNRPQDNANQYDLWPRAFGPYRKGNSDARCVQSYLPGHVERNRLEMFVFFLIYICILHLNKSICELCAGKHYKYGHYRVIPRTCVYFDVNVLYFFYISQTLPTLSLGSYWYHMTAWLKKKMCGPRLNIYVTKRTSEKFANGTWCLNVHE